MKKLTEIEKEACRLADAFLDLDDVETEFFHHYKKCALLHCDLMLEDKVVQNIGSSNRDQWIKQYTDLKVEISKLKEPI